MGQAKRRKQLDPNYGKQTLIQELIKKDKHFKNPEQVYIPAFLLLEKHDLVRLYPNGVLYGDSILSKEFAVPLKKHLDKVCNKEFHVLAYVDDDGAMLVPIPLDELKRSNEWAVKQKIKLDCSVFTL